MWLLRSPLSPACTCRFFFTDVRDDVLLSDVALRGMRRIFEREVCPFCAVSLVVASAVASVSERSLEPLKSLAAVRSCPLFAALAAFRSLSSSVSVTPRTFFPSRLLFFASLGHQWLHARAVRESSTTEESMEGLEKALRREMWRNRRGTAEQVCSSRKVKGERQRRGSRPQKHGWTKATKEARRKDAELAGRSTLALPTDKDCAPQVEYRTNHKLARASAICENSSGIVWKCSTCSDGSSKRGTSCARNVWGTPRQGKAMNELRRKKA